MDAPILQISYSLDKIDAAVQQFWDIASAHPVIAFNGTLGAGKTTFIRHLCLHLGVTDAVSSPTFAIINEYDAAGIGKSIFHLDIYRLSGTVEAIDAGVEDCIRKTVAEKNYCFIEWAQKAESLLPRPSLRVDIQSTGADSRLLEMSVVQ
jgi:tRNA threonylcarbamoyladenosine biosynthesis protein TsaE